MNPDGDIAFQGLRDAGGEGIYMWNDGDPTNTVSLIAETGVAYDVGTFTGLNLPVINALDEIAFRGTGSFGSGLFTNIGGHLHKVVKTGDTGPGGITFSSFQFWYGGFNNLSNGGLGGNLAFWASYNGGTQQGIFLATPEPTPLSTPAPVPEPATLLLLGSGLAGMYIRRRKRVT